MRKMITILSLIAVAALAAAFAYPWLAGGRGDPGGARQLVADGAQLLDVRTRDEFAAGHIAGAKNIPVQELEQRLGELGAKDAPLVVYCRSGRRSATAKRLLEAAGWTKVHDAGAMSSW
jgi:rhodanese-related sulfurtransferase